MKTYMSDQEDQMTLEPQGEDAPTQEQSAVDAMETVIEVDNVTFAYIPGTDVLKDA